MSSKKLLVATSKNNSKKGILTWEKNLIWLRNPSLLPLQKIILTLSTKQINQKHPKKKDKSSSNKYDKGKSLDKSRSTQRTETEETVKILNKSRSISSANLSEKLPK